MSSDIAMSALTKPVYSNALEQLADLDADISMPLDSGIKRYVLVLRAEGVETFESCEGGKGHAFTEPTVRFHGNGAEGYRAFSVAMNYGLPVLNLRRYYSVNDGCLEGPWWEMTFRTTDEELARKDAGSARI